MARTLRRNEEIEFQAEQRSLLDDHDVVKNANELIVSYNKSGHLRLVFKGEWGDEFTFAMLKNEWDQRKHTE